MDETFVLLHGSWHGGWAWEPTAWCLRELGHTDDDDVKINGNDRLASRAMMSKITVAAAIEVISAWS